MRVFLSILIIIFSLQSWAKSDDIKEFSIEGYSIGESLLDYFNDDQINKFKYPIVRGGKKYYEYHKVDSNSKSETYERIYLYFKTDDPKKIIQAIAGRNYYPNNINDCYALQIDIVKDLESIFTKANKQDLGNQKVSSFPDGNSYKNDVSFYFKDGSMVHTACYDYSPKDTSTQDRLSIAILSKQYLDWFWSL